MPRDCLLVQSPILNLSICVGLNPAKAFFIFYFFSCVNNFSFSLSYVDNSESAVLKVIRPVKDPINKSRFRQFSLVPLQIFYSWHARNTLHSFISFSSVISIPALMSFPSLSENGQQKGREDQEEPPENPEQHLGGRRTLQRAQTGWVSNRCRSHLLWEIHDLIKFIFPSEVQRSFLRFRGSSRDDKYFWRRVFRKQDFFFFLLPESKKVWQDKNEPFRAEPQRHWCPLCLWSIVFGFHGSEYIC